MTKRSSRSRRAALGATSDAAPRATSDETIGAPSDGLGADPDAALGAAADITLASAPNILGATSDAALRASLEEKEEKQQFWEYVKSLEEKNNEEKKREKKAKKQNEYEQELEEWREQTKEHKLHLERCAASKTGARSCPPSEHCKLSKVAFLGGQQLSIRVAEPGSIPEAVSAARDLTERLEAAARTWRSSTVEERHALMQAVKAMRAAAAPAAPKSINA